MNPWTQAGIALLVGYLAGSIPFAWLFVKMRTGTDLRDVGSGNVGATNASRVIGRGWFPLIFALDALKGAGPVLLVERALGWDGTAAVAAATGAILGHMLPFALGFRGGKAVATGAGTLAILTPTAAVGGVVGFILTAGATRYVSLGSIVAAVAAAASHFILVRDPDPAVTIFVVVLAVAVLTRHVSNMGRILAGTEPKIGKGPPKVPKDLD
ncbi:MAG: glycerol-3-phosphate 1-O-acyltransferase PlsY, partial [Planctomycetota bacterium]